MKEVNITVRITRNEMLYLTKMKRVRYGENGIIATTGHHRSWYLSETRYNMRALEEYRNKNTIETVERKR